MASKLLTAGKEKKPSLMKWADISALVHNGLYNALQEDLCTDFEIEVEGKSFRCHKLVLVSVSDYFKAMLRSGMKEVEEGKVKLQDVSAGAFQTLLSLLYPKDLHYDPFCDSTDAEMAELCNLAMRLQMPFLKDVSINYFKNTMSTENCIDRWNIGRNIRCEDVQDLALDFIVTSFDDLLQRQMPVLLSLDFQDLLTFLQDRGLTVLSEKSVWDLIIKWIEVDRDVRETHFVDLLRECCLTEIDHGSLTEEIAFNSMVRKHDVASEMVREAVLFEKHPGLHGNLELKSRPCHGRSQTLFLLVASGDVKENNFNIRIKETVGVNVHCWDMQDETWDPLKTPLTLAPDFACCVKGSVLYICGGKQDKSLLKYDARKRKCENLQDMPESLKGHAMVALDDSLFVLGGLIWSGANTTVYRYLDVGLDDGEWQQAGEIVAPVVHVSAVAVKEMIYLFGGETYREAAECVQVYNTKTSTGTLFSTLPNPCRWSRALCRGDTAYVVTISGDVVEMSTQSATCRVIATIPDFYHTNFGIDVRDGHMFVYGGRSARPAPPEEIDGEGIDDDELASAKMSVTNDSISNRVVAVDLQSGEIQEMDPLPGKWEVLGCARLVRYTV